MNLKALEILKKISKKINDDSLFLSEYFITNLEINEAINELKQYEQNFKDKEFEYRTECQSIVSAGRVEADDMPDRLAELEKVILDYYLAKGYQVGVGEWCFRVDIMSHYKQKGIFIYFYDNTDNESVNRFFSKTTKEMWDKAIKHFSLNVEPIQEDTKLEVDAEKYSSGFKVAGYASDGRE